jgi:hypothetical protein
VEHQLHGLASKFAVGTTLTVYPWVLQTPRSEGPPTGAAAITTGTVQSDGSLTVGGLAYDTKYWLVGTVGGVYRWISFRTVPEPTAPPFASRMPLNVLDFDAKGDGVSDDTEAIKLAIAYAAASGRGAIFFPSLAYRVTSKITVPTSVHLYGTPCGPTGSANSLHNDDWYDNAAGEFIVPPGAATFLVEGAVDEAFAITGAGSVMENFAFLWPDQIKPPRWGIDSPVAYPAAIKTSNGNGIVLRNLIDYNSYLFIDSGSPAGGVINRVWSGSHHQAILARTSELDIDGFWYGEGSLFNNADKSPDGPIIDGQFGGPVHLSNIAMYAHGGDGIKIETQWGVHCENVWLDGFENPFEITKYPGSGSSNVPNMSTLSNIEIGRGCTNGLQINDVAASLASGANISAITIASSILAGLEVTGAASVYMSAVVVDRVIKATGPGTGYQVIEAAGCGFSAERIQVLGGTVYLKVSGCKRSQTDTLHDTVTAGTLYVLDHDRMFTDRLRIPKGATVATGQNLAGNILLRKNGASQKTRLFIFSAMGQGAGNDYWELGAPVSQTLLTIDVGQTTKQAGAGSLEAAGTAPIVAYTENAGNDYPRKIPVYFNNQSGGSYTATENLDLVLVYCITPS